MCHWLKCELVTQLISPSKWFPLCLKFAKNVSFWFGWVFLSQIYSIFKSSHIVSLNITKPPWCTPTHVRLSNDTKCAIGALWFWRSLHNHQNKRGGVSHYGIAIYIQKYLKGKNRIVKTQIFHHAKIESSKNPLKETKILQGIITL